MVTFSISQCEKPIDENQRTAIIYSISEAGEYIVEIRYHNQQYFIGDEQAAEKFSNLGSAKAAALAHNAEKAFLALSKTYQEVEADSVSQNQQSHTRFDYVPIELGS